MSPRPPVLPGRSPFLVSTQWLASQLENPRIVILDGSYVLPSPSSIHATEAYMMRHIPGAQRFDIDIIKDKDSSLPHMLPNAQDMNAYLQELGISKDSQIVVYDQQGFFGAPRVWWMLRSFGLEVYILDGGFPRWMKENRSLEPGHSMKPRTRLDLVFKPELVSDLFQVRGAIDDKDIQIVDARAPARFHGAVAEPRSGLASGHIPGSINLPYTELLDNDELKPLSELKNSIVSAGVDLAKPVISSCGSGVTAAVLCFALASLGHKAWSLYDGSWAEWGSREDCPVENAA